MKRLPRLVIIPFAAALLSVGALAPHSAIADHPGQSVVEASQDFCIDPNVPCNDAAHNYNLGYEEVAAVNDSGATNARPDHVVLVCAKAYKASDGTTRNLAGHVFAGYDPGFISGTMTIYNDATEATTNAKGSVHVFAADFMNGTRGTASGTQRTNNATDLPLAGTITVTITGNLEDSPFSGGKTTTVRGSISCTIRLPYAPVGGPPPRQAPDSESVISDTDSD